MDQPILRNHELETLRNVPHDVFRRDDDRHHLPVATSRGLPAAPG
jgi:hypothetical protein